QRRPGQEAPEILGGGKLLERGLVPGPEAAQLQARGGKFGESAHVSIRLNTVAPNSMTTGACSVFVIGMTRPVQAMPSPRLRSNQWRQHIHRGRRAPATSRQSWK